MDRERVKAFVELAIEYDSWKEKLQPTYKKKGKVVYKKFDYNVSQAIKYHPLLRGKLAFNEFTQTICWLDSPPFEINRKREKELKTKGYIEFEETDISEIIDILSKEFQWTLSKERVIDKIKALAIKRPFHPLQDYLNSLTWDRKPRLENWLSTYLGAEDNKYNRLVGKFFLLSAVARVFTPGCKQDLLFILEGEQGKKKSTALRILAGEEWFTDAPVNIENKDFYLQIKGKWIVELAELDALLRLEPSKIKAILSASVDRYRPPYGKKAIDIPRGCIFTGTSNLYEYIKDYSGGRRFIPIRVGEIKIEELHKDKEQLWAEATYKYLYGTEEERRYYPLGEEYNILKIEQELRAESDPWVEEIAQWIKEKKEVTTKEILKDCLGISTKEIRRGHSTRIGLILLNKLGWRKKRTAKGMIYFNPKERKNIEKSERKIKRIQPLTAKEEIVFHNLTTDNKKSNATSEIVKLNTEKEITKYDKSSPLLENKKDFNRVALITKATLSQKNRESICIENTLQPPKTSMPESYTTKGYQQVKELQEMGFYIIPLAGKRPHPKSKKWKKEKFAFNANKYAQLVKDWEVGAEKDFPNIGITCGETRGKWSLVVIDIDDKELGRHLESKGLLPTTAKVRTGKGYHYYYRYYGKKTKGRNLRSLGVALEIKGEGQYITAPPSIHESGRAYEWEKPLSLMTELPKWIEKLMLEKIAPEEKKKESQKEKKKNKDKNIRKKIRKNKQLEKNPSDLQKIKREILDYYHSEISTAENGTRNDILNKWTYIIAGLSEKYQLTENEVWELALSACTSNGLINDDGRRSVEATFHSAWKKGVTRPLNSEPKWLPLREG